MNLGNRYSQHSFSQVPQANMARSKFDRSYAVKDTMDFDLLTPLFVEEIIPGDTLNLNVKSFCRLATQAKPLLDNMYMDYFFFFVPNRLVWSNWEKMNGAQDNPGDSTDFVVPRVTWPSSPGWQVGSIADHFGIPTGVVPAGTEQLNALPFRAYNLIWNEWFRDQNLQNSIVVNKGNGPDSPGDYVLQKRAKRPDYFTSALPWPQKGAAVMLPLGGTAPVYGRELNLAASPNPLAGHLYQGWHQSNTRTVGPINTNSASGGSGVWGMNFVSVTTPPAAAGTEQNISLGTPADYAAYPNYRPPYADLSSATATTINQLRQAMMMQSLLELDARGGTRYVEILKAHFNVISPDFRLQRPELLSTGEVRIAQHPVTQTSESTSDSPQANLAAFSTAAEMGNRIGFSKSFVEHGYVIGLVQARGDVTYQQGLNKLWSRKTRWDFFWPKLQELGEQAVLSKEIYLETTEANNNLVFGYQERYAEYRYHPSEIRGQFRSTFAQSLDVWHLAEEFGSRPALNATFIASETPIERNIVVTDPSYPALLCDYWFDMKHARPIMTYGIPATLGRF